MNLIKKIFKTIIVIVALTIAGLLIAVGVKDRVTEIVLLLLSILVVGIANIFIDICYSSTSKIISDLPISGSKLARYILDRHNLTDVRIEKISGKLTDHYDSKNKVVRLSSDVHDRNSIASIAVAAHECGHAIQDVEGNILLKFRNFIAPCINFITHIGYIVIIIGLSGSINKITMIGIIILLATLVFQLITLPIEFDASKKALKELEELNIPEDIKGCKLMLMGAAFTYVAAILSTILNILRLVYRVTNKVR